MKMSGLLYGASRMNKIIKTDNAPEAIGPYSQGIIANGLVYTAGQIPLDPETSELVKDSFEDEVERVLKNIDAILIAGGSSLNKLIKLTVFITDLKLFGELNEIFADYFPVNPPARSAVEVSALPMGARIEIEAIAGI